MLLHRPDLKIFSFNFALPPLEVCTDLNFCLFHLMCHKNFRGFPPNMKIVSRTLLNLLIRFTSCIFEVPFNFHFTESIVVIHKSINDIIFMIYKLFLLFFFVFLHSQTHTHTRTTLPPKGCICLPPSSLDLGKLVLILWSSSIDLNFIV